MSLEVERMLLQKELSKSIVRRELTNLINNDVIEFVGAPKTGGYRLKNNSSKK